MANRILAVLAILIFGLAQANASNSGVTYQGRILKPDGSPLAGANTQFRLQIRTPDAGNCLMYEELQALDMRATNGAFSLTINDGTGTRTDTTGFGLDHIFANRGTFTFNPATCSSGAAYTPNNSDGRLLVVYFKDETMASWEPIPAQKINFVPFAFEAKQVQGFTADSLLRVVNGSGDPLTGLAPLSNAQYTALMDLVNGNYTKANQLGGVALPTMSSGEVLGWNGTAWVSQPAVAGPNSVTTTMIQNNAVDSSKIANSAVGTAQIANNVSISTSGTLASAITTTRDFKIYAASPSTFYVGMAAPALAASYTLTWPMTAGAAGQVLTTDGSGTLTWAPATASSQWTTQAPGINYMSGNVGIGTTSPNARLEVLGATADNTAAAAHLKDSSGASLFFVRNDGSVGVGTTAPVGFEISKSGSSQLFTVRSDATTIATIERNETSASSSKLYFNKARGSAAARTAVVASDNVGNLEYNAYDGSSFVQAAKIGAAIDGTPGASSMPGRLTFSTTASGASSSTERMRIDSQGNVGIGTTAPTAALHLKAGTTAAGTSPLKFTSGPLLTTPEDGAMEYNSGSGLAFTVGTTRYTIPLNTAAGNFSNVSNISNASGSITMTPSAGNSVIVSSSTTSTNSTSGALIVTGGVGVGGALNAAGNITSGGSIQATTSMIAPQIYGGTTAAADIRIDGTSNATPGNVYLASGGAARVGVGTTSPTLQLSVVGSIGVDEKAQNNGTKASALYFGGGGSGEVIGSKRTGGGNQYGLDFYTASINRMTVTQGGNVGIGTTAPAAALDVATNATNALELRSGNLAGATTSNQILFGQQGTTNYQHAIKTRHDSATVSGNALDFYLWNQAVDTATTVGTKPVMTLNANGNVGLNAAGGAFVNTGANVPQAPLQIAGSGNLLVLGGCCSWNTNFNVDGLGALSISGTNTNFGFKTTSGGGGTVTNLTNGGNYSLQANGATFLTGTTAGLVGIGTTAPVSKFDVNAPIMSPAVPFNQILHDTTASAQDVGGGLAFGGYSDATTLSRFSGVRGGKENATVSNNAGYLALHTRTNGGAITEKVRVTSDGKMGVGTITPGVSLDVVGSARFSGGATLGIDGELFYDTMAHAYKYYDGSSSSWKSLAAGNITYSGTVWNQGGGNASYTAGYVGIGTNTPAYLLDLSSGSGSTQMHIGATGTNSASTIYENGSGTWTMGTNVNGVGGANFALASSSGTALVIQPNGNVGIGTTAPKEGVDSAGSGRFANIPSLMTDLSSNAGSGDSSLTVTSTSGYPTAGAIRVDGEIMNYSNVDATHFLGLTRGIYGTGAAAHSSGTAVNLILLSAGIRSSALPELIMYGDGSFQAGLAAYAGTSTSPTGWGAVAIGSHANSVGSSVALGVYAGANASGATSIGYQTTASGATAVALGYNTTASSYSQTAIGEANLAIGTENAGAKAANSPIFSIGNGTAGVLNSNSMIQLRNGQTIINSGTLTSATTPSITTVMNNSMLTSVGSTTDNTAAAFNATNSAGASKMYVRNDGNVGIGTTAPSSALDVQGSIRQTVAAAGNTAGYISTNASNQQSTTNLNPGIAVYNSGTNVWGVDLGYNSGMGRYRTRVFAPGSGDIAFSTAASSPSAQSSFTDNMVVTGSGNVGIGTVDPQAKLHVGSATSFMKVTPNWLGGGTWIDLDTTGPSGIGSGGPGSNAWIAYAASSAQWVPQSAPGDIVYRNGTGKLLFATSGAATDMSISAGKVGIGTASPQATLDINGIVKLKQNAAAPVTCAAGNEGTLALTTRGTLCNCHSSAWVSTVDGSTACVW